MVETYLMFAIVSILLYSFSDVLVKYFLKHRIRNFLVYCFYIFLINAFIIPLIMWSFNPVIIPSTSLVYLLISAITVVLGFGITALAFSKGDVSTIAPLTQLKIIFLIPVAFLFLGESYSPITYLWIILAMFGGILVSLDESFSLKSLKRLVVALVLISCFIHSFTIILNKMALQELDGWNLAAWRSMIIGCMALTLTPYVIRKHNKIDRSTILLLILLSTIFAFAASFLYVSYDLGNVIIPNTLGSIRGPLVVIITALFSRMYPGLLEQHSKKVYVVRFIGAVLIGISVSMILFG